MAGPVQNPDNPDNSSVGPGDSLPQHGLRPEQRRWRGALNSKPIVLVALVAAILLVACSSGAVLGAVFTHSPLPFLASSTRSIPSATATMPSLAVATDTPTQTPLPAATSKPTPRPATPTSPSRPRPTATQGLPWYEAPWPAKCNCSRGNLQLTPEVTIWTAGKQYYVFVTTTPGAHIQFRMTAPNGTITENNWEQSIADPAGNWSIKLIAPSGPGFALLQARTDKGAYGDTSVACMNN